MNIHWDNINKWLHFGQFILMLNNYFSWLPHKFPNLKEFTLFQIIWDTGSFYGLDLNIHNTLEKPIINKEIIEINKIEELSGISQKFIQITILGIGLRYQYQKPAKFSYKHYNPHI